MRIFKTLFFKIKSKRKKITFIIGFFLITLGLITISIYINSEKDKVPPLESQPISSSADGVVINIIPDHHNIRSAEVSFSYFPEDLPITDKIKNLSEGDLKPDTEKYEDWTKCNNTDAAGHPLAPGALQYEKFTKDGQGYGFLKNIVIPDGIEIYVKSNECGYSDAIYSLRIYKNMNLIHEFTDLFGGLRFVNSSPDNSKIVFTGVKNASIGDYSRESFIYDFLNDRVSVLPQNDCVSDRYHWVDNQTVASINILEYEPLSSNSRICLWTNEGRFLNAFEMNVTYYIAYPGGMLFEGDIDKLSDGRIILYYETKLEGLAGTYCTLFIQDGNKFRIQPIYKNPFQGEGICGTSSEQVFNDGQITQHLSISPIFATGIE